MIELGGENCRRVDGTYTARIELTDDGCRAVAVARCGHAQRWLEPRAKLESCGGRTTRVDVCAECAQMILSATSPYASRRSGMRRLM